MSHALFKGAGVLSHAALRLVDFDVHQVLTFWLALELWPRPRGSAAEKERVRAWWGDTCSHRKKTRIFQLIHGEICFTRRPETYPFRPAALTTTGDANICSSQRLEFTEGFRSSFVFGGAPVSSSPWVPFRALRWQLTLVPVSEDQKACSVSLLSGSPGVPVSAGPPAHSPRRGLAPSRAPATTQLPHR